MVFPQELLHSSLGNENYLRCSSFFPPETNRFIIKLDEMAASDKLLFITKELFE